MTEKSKDELILEYTNEIDKLKCKRVIQGRRTIRIYKAHDTVREILKEDLDAIQEKIEGLKLKIKEANKVLPK